MFADGLMQRDISGSGVFLIQWRMTICRLSLAVNHNNISVTCCTHCVYCIALLSYLGHNREQKHFTVVLSCMVFRI